MPRRERMRRFSRPWWLVIATVIAGLGALGFYVEAVSAESNDSTIEVTPWIILISGAALMPLPALLSRHTVVIAVSLLGCAIIFGSLAAVSFGVVALPAAIFAFLAYQSYSTSNDAERGVGTQN